MKIDTHHIYPKKKAKVKGKYPNWIHCPLNLIEIEHYTHINLIDNAPKTNLKAEIAREGLMHRLETRLAINVETKLWDLSIKEQMAVLEVYKWCVIDCCSKFTKPHEALEEYIVILKEWSERC